MAKGKPMAGWIRVLKWLAIALALLVLGVAAVWLVSRMTGPGAAERQALAMIDAPPAPAGRDGYAALYALRRDVPAAEQAQVLAEDVRRFTALAPATDDTERAWSSALLDWPEAGGAREGDPAWCPLRQTGCLQRVRAAPQAYAGVLERNVELLDRAAALADWDHFHSPFPLRFDTPLPAYQPLTWLLTREAWRFANGDVDGALAGACAGVSQGRKLIAGGDSLIGSMIGAALVDGHAVLLAEMLAELPGGHALPVQCDAAFQPPVSTADGACQAMLAEGRYSTGAMRSQVGAAVAADAAGRKLPQWGARLLFDPERTAARMAPRFAWYCGEQARELIAQDRPLRDPTPPPSPWSLACASNPVGCILADIAAPAYVDYALRLQDADARLRTLAALLWLRERGGAIDATALAQVPAWMQSPSRPLLLDVDAGSLGTAVFEARRQHANGPDGTWSVPLPGSRLQPSAEAP